MALPRIGQVTTIKPHNVTASQGKHTAKVQPKRTKKGIRCNAAAVLEARPLVCDGASSSASGPTVPIPLSVSAVVNGRQADVLAVWAGPRAHPALSEDGAPTPPTPASPSISMRSGGVLHIGEVPLQVVPLAPSPRAATSPRSGEPLQQEQQQHVEQQQQPQHATDGASRPVQPQQTSAVAPAHVVAAAAVAAAANQASGVQQRASVVPSSSMYMAGVAAGIAAATLAAQQQAAQQAQHAAQLQQQAQQPQPAVQPQEPEHTQQPVALQPATVQQAQEQQPQPAQQQQQQQPYWNQQQQLQQQQTYYPGGPLPRAPSAPQQQAVFYPPPHYYAPYAYPMGLGMMPGYVPYPHYDLYTQQQHHQQHPQQQQQWAGDDAASTSEASYPTFPPTPVPSTPSGSRSSVAGAASRAGGRSRGDTVTVSAASSVKDAAGAVAKVLERQGSCLLVALKRAGDGAASGATHVAAKTLAVSRFYVNARMGAAGAAGGAAARALVAAAEGCARADGGPADSAAVLGGKEEVTFVPFQRSQDVDSLGFVVFKVRADDLPTALPPPVGHASSLSPPRGEQQQQDGEQQQQQQQQAQEPPLLKAGAGTDVNKLSNAVIRNVLEWGRVSLQLAGPAACHAAMQALAKARARLAKKFSVSIAVASAFSTEDTSGSLGRATVFYRLDVLRIAGAAAEAAAAAWGAAGLLACAGDDGASSVAGDGASGVGAW